MGEKIEMASRIGGQLITLLNSVYNFFSNFFANIIKVVLTSIIHTDQRGFIKGRFIGENIRLTHDIIYECEVKNRDGLIISVDFFNAFDVISWDFIATALGIFGFGEDTRHWIHTLHKGSISFILQNGYKLDPVVLGRECRQGDPVSPYHFVIAAEILSEYIQNNQNIKGQDVVGVEQKISQYADDTTLFIAYEEKSFRECMQVLNEFPEISGLQIIVEKNKVFQNWGLERAWDNFVPTFRSALDR